MSPSKLSSASVVAGPARKMVIVPWRAPCGPPDTGASNVRQEPGAEEKIFRASPGASVVCTNTVNGRSVWSWSAWNTDKTWSASRTATWTLSTDGQSTAARSLPAGDFVSSDHSRMRS